MAQQRKEAAELAEGERGVLWPRRLGQSPAVSRSLILAEQRIDAELERRTDLLGSSSSPRVTIPHANKPRPYSDQSRRKLAAASRIDRSEPRPRGRRNNGRGLF